MPRSVSSLSSVSLYQTFTDEHQIIENAFCISDNILASHAKYGDLDKFKEEFAPLKKSFFSKTVVDEQLCQKVDYAFLTACAYGQIDVVEYCLNEGFDPNTFCTTFWSALNYACYFGNTFIANLLLEKGADIEGISVSGVEKEKILSPFVCSCLRNKENTALLLLEKGADPYREFYIEPQNKETVMEYLSRTSLNSGLLEIVSESLKEKLIENSSHSGSKRPRNSIETSSVTTIGQEKNARTK